MCYGTTGIKLGVKKIDRKNQIIKQITVKFLNLQCQLFMKSLFYDDYFAFFSLRRLGIESEAPFISLPKTKLLFIIKYPPSSEFAELDLMISLVPKFYLFAPRVPLVFGY